MGSFNPTDNQFKIGELRVNPSKPTAAALAALSLCLIGPAAHAQSSVNISGYLDIGAYRGFDKVYNVGTIQRSNIAFSGSEDLGGGLAATFKLSHRLDLDTGAQEGVGAKPFWQGESTVGLKGSFGSVRLGRALDVVWNNDWAFDPWGNFDRIASPAWNLWHYNYSSDRTSNNGSPEYGRLANGVFYDSPSFGGFSVQLSGAFENQGNFGGGGGNNVGVSGQYAGGPLKVMLAHSKNAASDKVTFLGAAYKIDALTLMGAYDTSTFESATGDSKAKVYTLGATYGIGSTTLKAGYGHIDVDGAKGSHIGLGADYSLSKRTSVYVTAGRSKAPGADDTHSAYGVGIAHSF